MTAGLTAYAVLALVVLSAADVSAEPAAPAEPDAYRTDDYRAPTPATLRGARVATTADAAVLWRQGAAFVDVLPRAPRPPNLPAGTLWRDRPHRNVPGSVWLPDTGYGALAAATERYFEAGLRQATGGDRGKPLVIYCQRACWMSWNAARRAVAMGYADVVWYPDGTDGWEEAKLPFAEASPVAHSED
jgi:PQQ-dependent catabolism-associated CXXCW motif protein